MSMPNKITTMLNSTVPPITSMFSRELDCLIALHPCTCKIDIVRRENIQLSTKWLGWVIWTKHRKLKETLHRDTRRQDIETNWDIYLPTHIHTYVRCLNTRRKIATTPANRMPTQDRMVQTMSRGRDMNTYCSSVGVPGAKREKRSLQNQNNTKCFTSSKRGSKIISMQTNEGHAAFASQCCYIIPAI